MTTTLSPPEVENPPVSDRVARGHEARSDVPRSSHADWRPGPERPDPIGLLEKQATTRVPELVPIRYGRMLTSPFAFYRGAAVVMASDLSTTPCTGIMVQACGDAHAANFGVFAAPDRRLVFDVNDFDETLPGPWEWDVKRLAASFAIAGRGRGFSQADCAAIVIDGVRSYRDSMAVASSSPNLQIWYERLDEDRLTQWAREAQKDQLQKHELHKKQFKKDAARLQKEAVKARSKNNLRALEKLTSSNGSGVHFLSEPPLLVPVGELVSADEKERLVARLGVMMKQYGASLRPDYRHLFSTFSFVDMARKVVGVGSVGTRAWVLLFTGLDERDPLVLQVKQAEASVLEPYFGTGEYHDDEGRRVVEGQRMMQAASDIMLGWVRGEGFDGVTRDFYVRQLWDSKFSADLDRMNQQNMRIYAQMCGWTLARAHARSGDRVAISAYLGTGDSFPSAILQFAESYARQNERDHEELKAAVASGRIKAVEGT